jgi:hypothetical protein
MRKVPVYSDDPAASRSSSFRCAAVALVLASLSATLPAQERADSLAERLRRAEAAIAALQVQVAEQAGSGVQTRSRLHLELHGRIMVNAFGNSRRVNNVDNPQTVLADLPAPAPQRGGGMAIRHTMLGLTVSGAEALGGAFTGDLDLDFHGGQMPSGGGRTFPLLRLRTARAMVHWSGASLMIGQETPLISDLNPVSVTGVGVPWFGGAGNLWFWLPQVRAGVERKGTIRLGIQGAVLAPTSGDAAAFFDTDNDLAERSQRPYLESRVHAGWGEEDRRGELGCGVHYGWLIPVADRVESHAFACDLRAPVMPWLELRGEFFTGQALRGLGGGAIGQNFTPANQPLKTTGGWLQLNLTPMPLLGFGVGCGGDHPEALAARRRNDVCATYARLRPQGPLFFGAEYRYMRTEHATGRYLNDHVTLAAGFEF